METLNNNKNKGVVEALYKALASYDPATLATLFATDLEWWFHGPPHSEHMMRVLTGKSSITNHDDDNQWSSWFEFKPQSITAIDEERVIAEGWEGAQAYWVHVWTVREGRVITQLREYFNTWVTVRDLRVHVNGWENNIRELNGNDDINVNYSDKTVWQSEPREHLTRSLPGLVLAI